MSRKLVAKNKQDSLFLPAYFEEKVLSKEEALRLPDGIWVYYESPFISPKTVSDIVFMVKRGTEFYGGFYVFDNHSLIAAMHRPVCAPSDKGSFRVVRMEHAEQLTNIPSAQAFSSNVLDIYGKFSSINNLTFKFRGEK